MDGDNGEKQNQQPREVVVVGQENPADLSQIGWEFLASADNTAGLEWLKAKFGSLAIRNPVDASGNPKPPLDVSQLTLQERIPANRQHWSISVYTDPNSDKVLVTSPGEHLFGVVDDLLNNLDASKKATAVKPSIEGTHVKQGWETAHEMVDMGVKKNGWQQIEILTPLTTSVRMSFAVCFSAMVVHKLPEEAIRGFDILDEDRNAMQRIKEALASVPKLNM